ncbi:MAG: alanine--tRNA ligase [Oscillospiraceae bacterium]|nr:alanine--tRNA ligase [Oscillospiraceae bacterium]
MRKNNNIKYFGLNELRTKFLDFIKSKDHLILDSFPLVPQNDKSLLIINSGMAPMKPYFYGEIPPPSKRAATCQKCVRVIDIEEVGKTSRHCTFFEMLGNFSFGDYFKKEALPWSWEFLTKILKIPEDLLYPSVYTEDDEAFDIWTNQMGIPAEKITKLGKKDNFWSAGPTGLCGPCSEIYFDRGEENGCGDIDCKPGCDCDRFIEVCNNVFMQYDYDGNNNYTPLKQKNIDMGMGLERLAMVMQQVNAVQEVDTFKKIIDKICEISGVEYNTDARPPRQADEPPATPPQRGIGETPGDMQNSPGEQTQKLRENSPLWRGADGVGGVVSLRIIADHIRSSVFMVCDNIIPSNEGRGYVLRRLLRRAARHGKLLKINGAFLYNLTDTVIDISKQAYPELDKKREYIKKVIKSEEDRFESTVNSGLEMLANIIKNILPPPSADGTPLKEGGKETRILPGEDIFKLYDTFGFPYDLTLEICEENNITPDKDGFDKLMQKQAARAREARANIDGWSKDKLAGLTVGRAALGAPQNQNDAPQNQSPDAAPQNLTETEFTGYNSLDTKAKVLAIIIEDGENIISADAVNEGEFILILDKTPFYSESGGQVGDSGRIYNNPDDYSPFVSEHTAEVLDCKKTPDGKIIHVCKISESGGEIKTGDDILAFVAPAVRSAIMRNHTAAHLLQAALRHVLGGHVEQSGSYVDSHRLRFDFTHFSAMTDEQIEEAESFVNNYILLGLEVGTIETDIEFAKKMGALALFGEKYGEKVRVVSISPGGSIAPVSVELCGGTHVNNTSKLGLFKIISESSTAAGIRRIEAVTGLGVLDLIKKDKALILNTAKILKANNPADISKRAETLIADLKESQRKIELTEEKIALAKTKDLLLQTKNIDVINKNSESLTIKYLAVESADITPDSAKKICDAVKSRNQNAVTLIASVTELPDSPGNKKITLTASCGETAVKSGANAGNLVKQIALLTGGNGGGRPDFAVAGIKDPARLTDALAKGEEILKGMLKGD